MPTSNDSATTQPARRTRFKPKVGIVTSAQRSPGKTSNQARSTTEVPGSNTSQPSKTHTGISQSDGGQTPSRSGAGITAASKEIGRQPNCSKSSASVDTGNTPSPGSRQITVTATVHSPPFIGQKSDGARNGSSPLTGVPFPTTKHTKAVDQISSGNGPSTLPSASVQPPSTGGDNSSLNKNIANQPTSKNDTMSVSKTGTISEPSSGAQQSRVSAGTSSSTDKDTATASAEKTSCPENNPAANATATTKPVRRAKIRPRVGLISAKTPVAKSSTKTPVEKIIATEKTNIFMSITTPSMNMGNSQLSINTARENTNTGTQPLSGCKAITGTTHNTNTESKNDGTRTTVVSQMSNSNKNSENDDIRQTSSSQNDRLGNGKTPSDSSAERSSQQLRTTSEKNEQPSNSTASTNVDNSSFEKSGNTSVPASSQVTRRVRFRPRLGVAGKPGVQVGTAKPDAVNKQATQTNMTSSNTTSKQRIETCEGTRSTEQSNAPLLSTNIENEQSESRAINDPDEVRSTCNENITKQNSSLASEELRDERQQTLSTADVNSQQTETCGDPKSSHDSSQGIVTSPQPKQLVDTSTSSSSPNCLPVLTIDHSILPPRGYMSCDDVPLEMDDTLTGLDIEYASTGLEVGNAPTVLENDGSGKNTEQSTEMSTSVELGAELTNFFHLENADDFLHGLLSLKADESPRKSDLCADTSARTAVDIDRISIDTAATYIHADPNKSISPAPSTCAENESLIHQATESVSNESRTLPQYNEKQVLASRDQIVSNDHANTASTLVTKRQRRRPRRNQYSSPIKTTVLDISTIPIASNIEIEAEISTVDDIDHPVLELPDDLIQEDLNERPRKTKTIPGGLEQRFQQRRSGTVKLVLSRKRTNVDKSGDEDNTSTTGDKGGASGSIAENIGAGDTEKIREVTRKARARPNVQIQRKTGGQKKSSAQNKVFVGDDSLVDNADTASSRSDTVVGFELRSLNQENLAKKLHHIPPTSQRKSSNDLVNDDILPNSSSVEVSDATTESITVVSGLGVGTGVETESVMVDARDQRSPTDVQSEVEIRDAFEISHNDQNDSSVVSNSKEGNIFQFHSSGDDSNVRDLSRESEIEIVMEVLTNGCETANITSSLQASKDAVYSSINTADVSGVSADLTVVDNDQSPKDNSIPTDHSPLETGDPITLQTNAISRSVGNLTSTRPEGTIPDPTPTTLDSSNISESTSEGTNEGANKTQSTRLLRSRNKDILTSTSGNDTSSPNWKSSTPLHDVSLGEPENAFPLLSDVNFNSGSQTNSITSNPIQDISLGRTDGVFETAASNSQLCDGVISTDKQREGADPISLPQIQNISLNIPESAIEAAVRSTNGSLSDVVECPECPELLLCLTTVDDSSIREQAQSSSQTQPGTLEDNVVRATRRASLDEKEALGNSGATKTADGKTASDGKNTVSNKKDVDEQVPGKKTRAKAKPKPNTQRKRKARGKAVDDEGSQDTAGVNDGSSIQENHDVIRTQSGTADSSLQDDGSVGDTCVQDRSSGHVQVQADTTEGSGGLEGTSSQVEPVQDDANKKTGSRKRQGKAIKPKIPAKRTRKKAGVVEDDVTVDGNGRETSEAAVSNVILRYKV